MSAADDVAAPATRRAHAPRWTAGGASVRGASHVRDGLPNQDAIAAWTSDAAAAPLAIVSIADGHGSPRHFRSALGASFAVDASVATLRSMAELVDAADPPTRARLVAVDLPHRIVAAWTATTRAHLAEHPLTAAELTEVAALEGDAVAADVSNDPLLAYGATVLAALVGPRVVVLTQLGDGDVLAVDADGTTTRPLPVDERLIGNLTTSICRAGAEGDFRGIALARRPEQAAFLLATDGYANSFRSDADFLQVGTDFVAMIGRDGIAAVAGQLDAILADASRIGSGDDITLGVLQCVDGANAARTAPAFGGAAVAHDATAGRLAAAERHVGRLRIIAALAVVVALGVVGWTWRDRLSGLIRGEKPVLGSTIPKGEGPGKPVKGRDGGRDDVPTKPGFGTPAAEVPKPLGTAVGPDGSADGGIVSPAAPTLAEPRARRTADAIRVAATIAFAGPADRGCRFEAKLWNAKDQAIASGAATPTEPAQGVGNAAANAAVPGDAPGDAWHASVTLAIPKEADPAKSVKSAKAAKPEPLRWSAALVCEGRTVADVARRPIDE